MRKLFIERFCKALLLLISISVVSCVNEEYDLSQGVDMDMILLQNAAMPLGNVPQISINTLLGDTDSESSMFNIDKYGNLSLVFGNDTISNSFTMPEVEIGGDGGVKFDDNVEVNFTPIYKGVNLGGMTPSELPSNIPNMVHFSDSEGGELERQFDLNLDKELPSQIIDIDIVNTDATIKYSFNVSDGSILYLKAGFSMEFPEFMVIQKDENCDFYEIYPEEPHKLVFTDDTRITDVEPLILEVGFTRMDIPEDAVVAKKDEETGKTLRYIELSDVVDVIGDLYLKVDDYAGRRIPECPVLAMDIEIENLKMTSAHVKLDLDIDIDDKKIELSGLPTMFFGEETVIDIYNPMLRFMLQNESPLDLYLNTNISSYSGRHVTDIHIGDCYPIYGEEHSHATEEVVVPSYSDAEYYFTRRGKHDAKGGEDIQLEDLGEIVKELPDSIIIHDIFVETDDSFVNIKANQECTVNMEYEFVCPFAFGKDLSIAFDYDLDLGLSNQAVSLDSLVVSMEMLNTIPLDFNITGVALDTDGNEIDNATVDMNLKLKAGIQDDPVSTPIEVVISTQPSEKSLAKLRLKMTATSSKEMEGILLNTAQGLAINNIKVSLPHGLVFDLNDGLENIN